MRYKFPGFLKINIALAFLLTPFLEVLAQSGADKIIPPGGVGGLLHLGGKERFSDVATYFITTFLGIVGLTAVAFLIYGGFRYIIAGGSSEQVESAKKTITNSIIGLTIILLSYVIVRVIANTLFGKT